MGSEARALQTLDEWIQSLRTVPQAIPEMAKALVPVIEGECASAVKEQRALDGYKWRPTKDGHAALQGAMGALTVRAIGTRIVLTLTGHEVFHQFGTHRTPQRPILPIGGMPDKLGNAIRKGIVDMGVAWMTRSGRHDKGSGGVKMRPSAGGRA